MAKTEQVDQTEVDEFAFRLYAERIAKMPSHANGEAASAWAYAKANDFMAVRARVKSGEAVSVADSKLSEASAPNLKPTHPHNLVSRRFAASHHGGEAKVLAMLREINAWLQAHPRSDEAQVAYDKLDWDVPTTNLARVLLPNYVSN